MTKNLGTVLVTGSAKRIGRELVCRLAKDGYDVVISYNKSKADAGKLAAEIAKKYQVKTAIFQSDLSDIKQAKKLAEFMKKNFPKWNLLINNASIFKKSKFISGSEKDLYDNLNIHLISPLILAKEFAKVAPKNSQIINIIDKNIARYDTSYFYYLLSKKSLAELTKMMALELAPQIRVNGIAPGFILNPIDEKIPSKMTGNIIERIPLKTKGEVENIWQAVEFLLKNKFINGQIIFVDGGASLNHAG
jgi:NAD(P)-dependent dehydrogenase (short-subunit alcohol dehydrogenase family)